MIPGLDISIYQGLVPEATWRCFYQDGQRIAVVGAAHPKPNPYAAGNFTNAERAGFRHFATYAALYPGVPGNGTIQVSKAMCGGGYWPRLSFVAVDCETDGITKEQIAAAVAAVQAENLRPVIYTARWWWRDHFGNPTDFKHLPLWNAYYDSDPDVDFPSNPYGGWTGVMGEQYAGTVTLCGVGVDKNSFDEAFIEEDDMADEATKRRWAAAAAIFSQIHDYANIGLPAPIELVRAARFLIKDYPA